MKIVYCCLLLLAAIVASEAYTAHWGQTNYTSVLLLRQTERYPAQKNKAWNVNIKFPHSGNSQYIIAAINVYDNFYNNSGAVPTIKSGGVGQRKTVINLSGKKSQGIDSTVEIWGRW